MMLFAGSGVGECRHRELGFGFERERQNNLTDPALPRTRVDGRSRPLVPRISERLGREAERASCIALFGF
jgi:hypothetical protein